MKSKTIFLTIIFLSLNSSALAAPSISSVSGTISDGQVIAVAGSGFGANGPNIIIFDDYEKGISGNQISTIMGSAATNQWSYTQATVVYSNNYTHSGTLSQKSDWSSDGYTEGSRLAGISFNNADEVFFFFLDLFAF